ncbi:hypothetical protein SAMN05216302_101429 [Nitrosomonas aestuarii]|uniref:Uncharacterized protein n=1 Tax=Nitrosomonas aestuarii TaxID=52441 RepID=A0A1I4C1P6_9PROT|nr:hypothetical protein [Nitrosomonas aestuarii]SFK74259.1 hypothetical protein SAMN05216302_101429 [Nitrosomonas aestuarii]
MTCPHSEKIGYLEAKVHMLEEKIKELESIAKANATAILVGETKGVTNNRWLDHAARFIGYLILIIVLVAAGKVTGVADLIIKIAKF